MYSRKTPNLVAMLILTLVTVLAWVFFDIYHAIINKPAPIVPDEIMAPIVPKLEREVIDQMNTKVYFNESDIPKFKTASNSAEISLWFAKIQFQHF